MLERDSATDLITDFELGTDLLDLSRLTPHLSGSRMVMLSLPNSAEIYMDDEVLVRHSTDGKPLSHAAIMDRSLLKMSRLSLDDIVTSGISLSATAGDAADRLIGTNANDLLRGSAGNDRIEGCSGNDRLLGDTGNYQLDGGGRVRHAGGGAGNDTLQGDFNADTFVFVDGFGQDAITDFDALSPYERIDLRGVSTIVNYSHLYHHRMVQAGDDVVITAGQDRLTIEAVALEDLGSDDFLF